MFLRRNACSNTSNKQTNKQSFKRITSKQSGCPDLCEPSLCQYQPFQPLSQREPTNVIENLVTPIEGSRVRFSPRRSCPHIHSCTVFAIGQLCRRGGPISTGSVPCEGNTEKVNTNQAVGSNSSEKKKPTSNVCVQLQ